MASADDHDSRDTNNDRDPIKQVDAVTVEDGRLILYDEANPSAWIRSDTAVRPGVIR